tara:strand:+ start:122 stop:412 length:291 start_codon:yes stop_codon:yes gene_type:complete
MIKVTEVITAPREYDAVLKKVTALYSLKILYINPKFIVSMTDNEKFNSLHKVNPVVAELIPEAKFTRLILAAAGHGGSHFDILGAPEQHLKKILGE